MNEPGRVMAIDVGGRRIGVALSDTLRILASPLTTLRVESRRQGVERVAALIRQHQVSLLVVGLPLTLSGEVGPQAKQIHAFVDELRHLVQLPIELFDERLTTVEAERMLSEAGVKPEDRRRRLDELAATIILRDWLGSQRSIHPQPPLI